MCVRRRWRREPPREWGGVQPSPPLHQLSDLQLTHAATPASAWEQRHCHEDAARGATTSGRAATTQTPPPPRLHPVAHAPPWSRARVSIQVAHEFAFPSWSTTSASVRRSRCCECVCSDGVRAQCMPLARAASLCASRHAPPSTTNTFRLTQCEVAGCGTSLGVGACVLARRRRRRRASTTPTRWRELALHRVAVRVRARRGWQRWHSISAGVQSPARHRLRCTRNRRRTPRRRRH